MFLFSDCSLFFLLFFRTQIESVAAVRHITIVIKKKKKKSLAVLSSRSSVKLFGGISRLLTLILTARLTCLRVLSFSWRFFNRLNVCFLSLCRPQCHRSLIRQRQPVQLSRRKSAAAKRTWEELCVCTETDRFIIYAVLGHCNLLVGWLNVFNGEL